MQALRCFRRSEPRVLSALRILYPVWRMTAKFKGEASFRVRQRSSSKVTCIVKFVLDSMPQWASMGEDGSGIGFEGGDVEASFESLFAGFLIDAPGCDGGERAEPFQSGWRSASQFASAAQHERSSTLRAAQRLAVHRDHLARRSTRQADQPISDSEALLRLPATPKRRHPTTTAPHRIWPAPPCRPQVTSRPAAT